MAASSSKVKQSNDLPKSVRKIKKKPKKKPLSKKIKERLEEIKQQDQNIYPLF